MSIGLRRREIGARLRELFIHFRRVDVRQQIAFLNPAADIVIPLLEIAVGARVNRGLDERFHRSRQHQVFLARFGSWVDHANSLNRKRFRFFREGAVFRAALQ